MGRPTFADVERLLALLDSLAGTLEDASRGFQVLEELRVWRRDWVCVEVADDCPVEECLLRAVNSGVVGQAGVKPSFAVPGYKGFC